jgi:oligoribonuclease
VLAWIDLEMTGLEPARHTVVEIATLITDDELEIVAEGPNLVIHQPPEALELMDDVVRNMHTRSGLLEEIAASTVTLADAEAQTLAFLVEHLGSPRTVPLCGNTIGTDRRFLATYMPSIENYLHYRSVDVSTVKELLVRWNPAALVGVPPKAENHRALEDIRASVAELRHYRQTGFAAPLAVPEPSTPGVPTASDGSTPAPAAD